MSELHIDINALLFKLLSNDTITSLLRGAKTRIGLQSNSERLQNIRKPESILIYWHRHLLIRILFSCDMIDMFELENNEKDDASMMTRVSRVSSLENKEDMAEYAR